MAARPYLIVVHLHMEFIVVIQLFLDITVTFLVVIMPPVGMVLDLIVLLLEQILVFILEPRIDALFLVDIMDFMVLILQVTVIILLFLVL